MTYNKYYLSKLVANGMIYGAYGENYKNLSNAGDYTKGEKDPIPHHIIKIYHASLGNTPKICTAAKNTA